MLEKQLAEALGWPHGVLCGRGTTALWLALRAIRRRDGPGQVIIPNILCASALEGVLLAGFSPLFADVIPGRYTLSPTSVARLVSPHVRAVLVAHLYGHVADIEAIRQTAPGIPIIEDAVQGVGGTFQGRSVGSLGDMAFLSFSQSKPIHGRGGMLLLDDDGLVDGIKADLTRLPEIPDLQLNALDALLPPLAAAGYAFQLRTCAVPALLRHFDGTLDNQERILASWETLQSRVAIRNAQARWFGKHLAGLPLALPDIRSGDAIWCYTLAAPSAIFARRLICDLNKACLSGSGLYPPLSRLFQHPMHADGWTPHLVNLWVSEDTHSEILQRTVDVIAAIPWPDSLRE